MYNVYILATNDPRMLQLPWVPPMVKKLLGKIKFRATKCSCADFVFTYYIGMHRPSLILFLFGRTKFGWCDVLLQVSTS